MKVLYIWFYARSFPDYPKVAPKAGVKATRPQTCLLYTSRCV